MSTAGVDHLTGATVADAPPPCRECVWWQTRPGRDPVEKRRWIEAAEDEFGPWGKVYRDGGRVIGLVQYGPADAFPRAHAMPAGPPSRDAAIITCAYLIEAGSPWTLQSLILAAIGECRDRGLHALEAYAYRYGPTRPSRSASSATEPSSRRTSYAISASTRADQLAESS